MFRSGALFFFSTLSLLAISVTSFTGCGRAPDPSATNVSSAGADPHLSETRPVPDKAEAEVSGSFPDEFSTATASDVLQEKTPESEVVTKPAPPAPTGQKAPVPTAEQLARWKTVTSDPVELLARNRLQDVSFVSCAASSNDKKWFAVGGDKLTLWNAKATEPTAILWRFGNDSSEASIKSVAISPSGKWLTAGDSTGVLKLWSLDDQKEIASKQIYQNDIVQVAFSSNETEVATATYQNEVSIWNVSDLSLKNKFATNGYAKLFYIDDNKLVAAGQSMQVWDTNTKELLANLSEAGYSQAIAQTADQSWIATCPGEKLKLTNTKDDSLSWSIEGSFAQNEILEFTDDAKVLWSANNLAIRAWDLERRSVMQVIDVHGPAIVGLAWLPSDNLLRVTTEDGTIKLWGTKSAAELAGYEPLDIPIAASEQRDDGRISVVQLMSVIDLRTFPRPPGSKQTIGEPTVASFETPESIEEVKSFYRYTLGQNGWTEQPGNPHTPDYLNFEKDGFRLFLSTYTTGPSSTSVSLTSLGNSNAATIPSVDSMPVKVVYADKSSALYQVQSDLLTVEVELLRKLHAAGWMPYSRLNASHSEDVDKRDMEFVKGATTLRVSVAPVVDDPSSLNIQYTTFVAQSQLPVPKDCTYIECDVGRSPALVAFTSQTLDQCQSFYNDSMKEMGWHAAEAIRSKEDDVRWLNYFRGQQEISIKISKAADKTTLIRSGEYADENSWQLASVKSEDRTAEPDVEAKPGIEAADIPIYKQSESTSVQFDAQGERIEVTLNKTSHVEIVDYYAKIMGDLGWKEEPNGFREEDYAFVTFTRDKSSIQLRVNSTPSLNQTKYILSDDGILWTKPIPTASKLVSYASWLRKNQHRATLDLLDQYVAEMSQ